MVYKIIKKYLFLLTLVLFFILLLVLNGGINAEWEFEPTEEYWTVAQRLQGGSDNQVYFATSNNKNATYEINYTLPLQDVITAENGFYINGNLFDISTENGTSHAFIDRLEPSIELMINATEPVVISIKGYTNQSIYNITEDGFKKGISIINYGTLNFNYLFTNNSRIILEEARIINIIDMNNDSELDITDISVFVNNIWSNVSPPGSEPWDINYDGKCDVYDLSVFVNYVGANV